MINLKYFKDLFESQNEDIKGVGISIDEFCTRIGIHPPMIPAISEWWSKNRSNIKIHFFPFGSIEPIAGVFLGTDTICINENSRMPPHIKMFLSLHESRHCDQHRDGIFMDGYYNTVLNNDLEGFLEAYSILERDANDYAIGSMREIGFSREMDREENMLRGNERAGNMVYRMMKRDIERLNPTDFFDLLKKQIF
jgi:hypothetical protein